jgi:hypothetical protein
MITELTLAGHHPLYRIGGAGSFSPVISDAISRSLAVRNIVRLNESIIALYRIAFRIVEKDPNVSNESHWHDRAEEYTKMVNRTAERISAGQLDRALTSSTEAAKIIPELLLQWQQDHFGWKMMAGCCPEMVYISKHVNRFIVAAIVISFLTISLWLRWKSCPIMSKKRYALPAALRF